MKIEKINIDSISDDKKFLDVALLVDQPYFLDLVDKARKVWKKELGINLPMAHRDYLEFIRGLYQEPEKQEGIEGRIEKSLQWLHVSIAFAKVIKTAILSGEVRSADFRPVLLSSEAKVNPNKINLKYNHFLLLTPNATKKDVAKAFLRYQAGFKKELSEKDVLRYDEFDDQYPKLTDEELVKQRNELAGYAYLATPGITSRAKTELRKYRKWYWMDIENRANFPKGRLPRGRNKDFLDAVDKLPPRFRSGNETEIKNGIKFYKHLLDISKTR